ncbi:MAG: phosphatase PAP2 family protein [Promethearchaeota archaeon]
MTNFTIKPRYLSLLIGGIAVAILTIIFMVTNLDLEISGAFYNSAGPIYFPVGDEQPWAFFNEKDDYIVYSLAIFMLFLLIFGLVKKRFRPFLMYALFILIAYIIGPGLIVNVLLKGTDFGGFYIGWSRPRPRELTLFGGTADFYHLWEPAFLDGLQETNSSFPSGHVTVGAIFIVIYFIFNNVKFISKIFGEENKKKTVVINTIKYGGLGLSIFLSIMLAGARITAGAHFASDCLYSVVFTWVPAAFVYYVMFRFPKLESKAMEKMVAADARE